ncbi:acyl-CoA dehydrogenase family protein, partial [Brevundimonas sp.]|uniref:acyl-CoA dehydrogenase family protein n=1 Tax=Brevundimonas sp. TaxID=1871086 RepID=UPI002ED79BB0
MSHNDLDQGQAIAARVERFVRDVVIPYEKDPRATSHGPTDDLVVELRTLARAARLMTPHIGADGSHLSQRSTALVLQASGLSPLGPVALNVMAPDEGNMYLLGQVASETQKRRFLAPLVSGQARSAFFMTEPAEDDGAGADPSMLKTTAVPDGDGWRINGRKAFITGAVGASVGIVMART